ncbi:probable xyloglucan endotransglucosylase/hydrolase protein 30 [Rhodamnia argentea]|uniref:Xyloglucan endotransglucosylase/hydrolase n=1 Tax=Rhodamnia argentea TaxID=178133 RepID=A0A8B8PGW9_9MYRT|nr:probable xyloglucan endotransglucosylase/hydrolase protein 30 [Rhodamnia argentea]
MDPLRRLISVLFPTSSSSSSSSLILLLSLLFCAASATAADFDIEPITFDEAYSPLFGDANLIRSDDDRSVRLLLDRYSGSGFISSNLYKYGFFTAKIKLPSDYTAGIVVAFYTSNGDVFEKTHDELDIEFLGNIRGKKWRFQTNLYGNGSTSRGREERYTLWFDPTRTFHRYSILWTANNIIFYVDEVPIREIIRNDAMGGDYPAKPMALYATIWDASDWATSGGRYKVNYKYAPFVTEFKDLFLQGCPVNPLDQYPSDHCYDKLALLDAQDFSTVTAARRMAMRQFRQNYMYYSYCYDTVRYPIPPPECVILPSEKERFKDTGRLKFGGSHKRRSRRTRWRGQIPAVSESEDQSMM